MSESCGPFTPVHSTDFRRHFIQSIFAWREEIVRSRPPLQGNWIASYVIFHYPRYWRRSTDHVEDSARTIRMYEYYMLLTFKAMAPLPTARVSGNPDWVISYSQTSSHISNLVLQHVELFPNSEHRHVRHEETAGKDYSLLKPSQRLCPRDLKFMVSRVRMENITATISYIDTDRWGVTSQLLYLVPPAPSVVLLCIFVCWKCFHPQYDLNCFAEHVPCVRS